MMKRYDHLIRIIEKGLQESSKCIDAKQAVLECYGDDISMFEGGDGIDMLSNLIKDILEKINDTFLQSELPLILREQKVQQQLDILDRVIQEFDAKQKAIHDKEHQDIQSAREAVESVQFIPHGIDISQVKTYHTYQKKTHMRDDLLLQIERAQKERETLLHDIDQEKNKIQGFVESLEKHIVEPLSRNADICSFNEIK